MLKRIRRENEDGFTLIELMVVVLIISILIAIAIPTFLGAREGAQDRGAQSNLRNSLTSAKVLFADDGDYGSVDKANMEAVEPSLTFDVAADFDVTASNQVVLAVSTTTTANDTVTFYAYSDSGECFHIRDVGATGTEFAQTTFAGGACPAPAAADWTADGW